MELADESEVWYYDKGILLFTLYDLQESPEVAG